MKAKQRGILLTIIIVLVVIIAIYFVFSSYQSAHVVMNLEKQTNELGKKGADLTNSSLESFLSASSFTKDLPSSAVISLTVSGNISREYTITKKGVKEARAKNPDILITLPDSYVDKLKTNFCGAVKEAKNNGDLGVKLMRSKFSLFFKYRNMYKYRSCVGL